MHNSKPFRSRRGFTIRELLSVVALFSFFAAIIIPTDLGTSRRNKEKSTCRGNLKQIMLALRHYQYDWDNYFPLVFGTGDPPHGWAGALVPYLRDTKVFQCPSDTNAVNESPAEKGFTDYW